MKSFLVKNQILATVTLGVGVAVVLVACANARGTGQSKKGLSAPVTPAVSNIAGSTQSEGDIQVELIGISDTRKGRLVDHMWSIDGKPIYGIDIEPSDLEGIDRSNEIENAQTRYLLFGISCSSYSQCDVQRLLPEVPQSRRRDNAEVQVPNYFSDQVGSHQADKRFIYIAKTTTDELKTGSYSFVFAQGPWKEEATISNLPKDANQLVVAQGDWGQVQFTAAKTPPMSMSADVSRKESEMVGGNYMRFTVKPQNSSSMQVVLEYVLKDKRQPPHKYLVGATTIDDIEKVIVKSRPCQARLFKNIAVNPDPVAWKGMYRAEEGKKVAVAVGSYGLLEGVKYMGEFYAPDGQRWLDYADRIGTYSLDTQGLPSNIYLAILRFNDAFMAKGLSARLEAFTSTSSLPGRGLQQRLLEGISTNGISSQIEILLDCPKKPDYIQVKVVVSNDRWNTIGSAPSIDLKLLDKDKKYLNSIREENMRNSVAFELSLDPKGHLGWTYSRPYLRPIDDIRKPNLINWNPKDLEARVVLRLRSGERIPLPEYMQGASFDRDLEFELSLRVNKRVVRLRDIAAFEVQTRGYSAPIYVVTKLPKSGKLDARSTASILRKYQFERDEEATKKRAYMTPDGKPLPMLPTTRPK